MEFNDLLRQAGHDPREVAIMLHSPAQSDQRRVLLALADEEPALFEAYQDNHPRSAEATLKKRPLAASFVVDDRGEARFAGLYRVAGWAERSMAEMDSDPSRQALIQRFRDVTFAEVGARTGRTGRAVFDLRPLPDLAELRGRLVVPRPAGRAYMRLAENCALPVRGIEREARFLPPAPEWDDLVVSGAEVRSLPRDWQARLREWRGVYHILDAADGARYVGAAYGSENLLGRWQGHVAGNQGITAELAGRDPAGFRFSILELVAPTAPADMVIAAEGRWKRRLQSREWGLNRN